MSLLPCINPHFPRSHSYNQQTHDTSTKLARLQHLIATTTSRSTISIDSWIRFTKTRLQVKSRILNLKKAVCQTQQPASHPASSRTYPPRNVCRLESSENTEYRSQHETQEKELNNNINPTSDGKVDRIGKFSNVSHPIIFKCKLVDWRQRTLVTKLENLRNFSVWNLVHWHSYLDFPVFKHSDDVQDDLIYLLRVRQLGIWAVLD